MPDTGWVSWFTGDATDMFPSSRSHKAEVFTELMGGVDAVLDAAKRYHGDGDHQIAAELAQLALRADPESEDARLVEAAALRARGYQEINPIARSWYLTGALELEGTFDPIAFMGQAVSNFAASPTVSAQVQSWRYHLDAQAAGTNTAVVGVRAIDAEGRWTVRLRTSIVVVHEGIAADCEVIIETDGSGLAALPDTSGITIVSGDGAALEQLVDVLDLKIEGFAMHQR